MGNEEWIFVSDKLPEDGTYLVTINDIFGRPTIVTIRSYAKDLYSIDEFDFRDKRGIGGWYDYDSGYGYWEDTAVVAWQYLPEPYKESEDK